MGDIDHFKQINDQYGHLTGDEILRRIGELFKGIAEKHDAQAFRYGGEEFAFLLPELSETLQIRFFDDIYSTLDRTNFSDDCVSVTMSFGIASSINQKIPDKLLGCADQLLYCAKAAGKNQAKFETGYTFFYSAAKAEIAAAKQ